MKFLRRKKILSYITALAVGVTAFCGSVLYTNAEVIDYQAQAEAHKLMPVESNEIEGWPQGPAVSAKSAILLEANTGTVLYAKNIHEKLYPASTTKILTAYIARQKGNLSDMITYSSEAVNSINWMEDSNIGIKVGESITLEQSLYGLLVGSANECGNAIGEYISGSIEDFVKLMNETAKELGCTDSNFVTTNGKHDEEHYTSAHDLGLIAQKFFDDELLCKMSSQKDYVIPQSETLSQKLIPYSKNKLLPGKTYAYEYLVGSKTGYTTVARQNLVSCAEKDGMKLICVVMNDEAPMQYTDTIDLFNYGFSNFKAINVSENDKTYAIGQNGLFANGSDVFGSSAPILSMDEDSYVILPADASFEDVDSELSYEDAADGQAAVVHYTYNGQPVGTASILFSDHTEGFDFNAQPVTPETESVPASADSASSMAAVTAPGGKVLLLDPQRIMIAVLVIAVVLLIALIVRAVVRSRKKARKRSDIMSRRKKKDEIIDFDKYIEHF